MSNIYTKLGLKIREVRESRKITQEKLALNAGLNRAYIGYIERGERKPSIATVEKIAQHLGVNIQELFRTASK